MIRSSILPSDGLPIEIRQLEFLELEKINFVDIGPYIHHYYLTNDGSKVSGVPHFLTDWPEIPKKPKVETSPEMTKSEEADSYWLFQAVFYHELKRKKNRDAYLTECAKYILDTCVKKEDRPRILTENDFDTVYNLALFPEITIEQLKETLKLVYDASWQGNDVWDSLQGTEKSKAKYNVFRVMEVNLMRDLKIGLKQYSEIPLYERAILLCGLYLPKWIEHLEFSEKHKNAKNS